MTYRTRHEDASVSPNGWTRLPSGTWVTRVPLVDGAASPLFAHLDYEGALAVAARLGGQLVRPETVVEIHAVGHQIRPYPLPDSEQRIAFRSARGKRPSLIIEGAAWDRALYAPMASREWCERHDFEVWSRIAQSDWDLGRPVSGAGKLWVHGALPGKSRLMGWPRRTDSKSLAKRGAGGERDWLQPLMNAHDRRHHDYGTLTVIECDDEPVELVPDTRRKVDSAVSLPHGYRCSVAELVADARVLGTWHPRGSLYVPQVGDLLVSARSGEDPTTGGRGHVEAVTATAEGHDPTTVGGNEGNTWTVDVYRLASPLSRGCIERGELGRRAVAVAIAEHARGIRELPGAQHHARIQLYHAGARRGGSPLAGMPGHESEGVAVLGARAPDEVAWCASAASWCAYQAALQLRG